MTGSGVVHRPVALSTVVYNGSTDGDPWNSYWAGGRRASTFAGGGPQDAALEIFWGRHFDELLGDNTTADTHLLDIGAGSGAVTGFAFEAAQRLGCPLAVSCLDTSAAALALVAEKHAGVKTVCASAADIPLSDGSIEAVVSQFGIEYAGINAASEAGRILRPGGSLALVMHHQDGAIYRECRANADALDTTLDSGVLTAFKNLLLRACELREGRGRPKDFAKADKALAPGVQALESIIREQGKDCCGGSLFRLYTDIAHMYGRPYSYEASEIKKWVKRAKQELGAFRARMQSMLDAALDERTLALWRSALTEAGLRLEDTQSLTMGEQQEVAAWVIRGEKSGA